MERKYLLTIFLVDNKPCTPLWMILDILWNGNKIGENRDFRNSSPKVSLFFSRKWSRENNWIRENLDRLKEVWK